MVPARDFGFPGIFGPELLGFPGILVVQSYRQYTLLDLFSGSGGKVTRGAGGIPLSMGVVQKPAGESDEVHDDPPPAAIEINIDRTKHSKIERWHGRHWPNQHSRNRCSRGTSPDWPIAISKRLGDKKRLKTNSDKLPL
jgi:hypothetical protein